MKAKHAYEVRVRDRARQLEREGVLRDRHVCGDDLGDEEGAEGAQGEDADVGRVGVGDREHRRVLEALQEARVVRPVGGERRPPLEERRRLGDGEWVRSEVGKDVLERDVADEVPVAQDGEEARSPLGDESGDDRDRLDKAGELRRRKAQFVRSGRADARDEGDGRVGVGLEEGRFAERADDFLRGRLGKGKEPAGCERISMDSSRDKGKRRHT